MWCDCCLCALMSVLRSVTASWLKVKESINGASRSLKLACGSVVVITMAGVSLTQQQYQQFIDRISGLKARIATLQTHAEAQKEQIRMAEIVIQQLRANPTNPSPPLRAAFQKPMTEGGAFKALTKYTGNLSECHDWSSSVRRVLTRADERFAGPLQWISGQILLLFSSPSHSSVVI